MTADFNMRTTHRTVDGEANVKSLCSELISASQWFSVLPLPDDKWEISVKEENGERLQVSVNKIEQKNQNKP